MRLRVKILLPGLLKLILLYPLSFMLEYHIFTSNSTSPKVNCDNSILSVDLCVL